MTIETLYFYITKEFDEYETRVHSEKILWGEIQSAASLLRRAIQAISQVCTTGCWRPSSHVDVQGTLPVCT